MVCYGVECVKCLGLVLWLVYVVLVYMLMVLMFLLLLENFEEVGCNLKFLGMRFQLYEAQPYLPCKGLMKNLERRLS